MSARTGCQASPASDRRSRRVSQHRAMRRAPERGRTQPRRTWLVEVIEQSRDAIYVVDPGTGRIRYANRGASRDAGYAREELVGRAIGDLEPGLTDVRFRRVLNWCLAHRWMHVADGRTCRPR